MTDAQPENVAVVDNSEDGSKPVTSPAEQSQTLASPPSSTSGSSDSDILASLGDFIVYNPPPDAGPSRSALAATANVPESFFEPTAADLKYAQSSLQARTKSLNDAPLQTQRLRNEREDERRKRWPTARIRVKFANQTMLEKTFPSSDKIKSVYAFVRGCLNEEAKQHKFVLFTAPPRRDLKVSDTAVRDKSLLDLQLAPRGVLLFQFLDDSIPLDAPSSSAPLHPLILSQSIDLPPPPSLDPPSTSSTAKPTSGSTGSGAKSTSGSGEKKTPKWFKIGKKK